jgi:tetratricopeptide (TPR) repeat protein
MTRRSLTGLLLLCALCGPTACVRSQSTQLREDMNEAKTERDPKRLLELAMAFRAVGDLTRAEQYLNAAREQGADDREVFPRLLEICVADQRYRSAVEYIEEHLKRHPTNYRLRLVLGGFYLALGDAVRAKQEYTRVVEAEPELATAHYSLAVLLRDEFSDSVGADQHFREYLRLVPQGDHSEEARASLMTRIQ